MNARLLFGIFLLAIVTPANAANFTHNNITIICPWAEATPNGITIAPVYMGIYSSPQTGDRLTSAAADIAGRVELATYTQVGGVLQRQPLDHIAVEAGQSVWLVPGGLHLLLVDLKQPLVAGTKFDLWLQFATAGGFPIQVDVVPVGSGPACGMTPGGVVPGVPGIPGGPPPVIIYPSYPPPHGSF